MSRPVIGFMWHAMFSDGRMDYPQYFADKLRAFASMDAVTRIKNDVRGPYYFTEREFSSIDEMNYTNDRMRRLA